MRRQKDRQSASTVAASPAVQRAEAESLLPPGIQISLRRLPPLLEQLLRRRGLSLRLPDDDEARGRDRGRGGSHHRGRAAGGGSGSGIGFGPEPLRELNLHLDALGQFVSFSDARELQNLWRATDDRLLNALLGAVAVAARMSLAERVSAGGDQLKTMAQIDYAAGAATFLLRGVHLWPDQPMEPALRNHILGFARKLLRMQTLQALSCRLAEVAEVAADEAAAHDGGADAAAVFPPSGSRPRRRAAAGELLMHCEAIVLLIGQVLTRLPSCWACSVGGNCWQFAGELAAALRDSAILEHVARLLVPRSPRHGHELEQLWCGAAPPLPPAFISAHATVHKLRTAATGAIRLSFQTSHPPIAAAAAAAAVAADAAVAAEFARQVLTGRCTQTAALLYGLAAMRAVDGGPMYGFPPELMRRIPVKAADGSWLAPPLPPPLPSPMEAEAPGGGEGSSSLVPARKQQQHQQRRRRLPQPQPQPHTHPQPQQAQQPQGQPPRELCADALWAMLAVLLTQPRKPPPGRCATVALLLRLGRVGLASLHQAVAAASGGAGGAAAAGGGGGGAPALAPSNSAPTIAQQPPQPPQGIAILSPKAAARLATRALLTAHEAFGLLSGSPAWAFDEVAECWRLTCGLARQGLGEADPDVRETFGSVLALALRDSVAHCATGGVQQLGTTSPSGNPDLPPPPPSSLAAPPPPPTPPQAPKTASLLPAAPPPYLAAALAVGVLPCLELLMRRAGQKTAGPEATLLSAVLQQRDHVGGFFPVALAYGKSYEAVALVATVGKLFRRLATSAAGGLDTAAAPGLTSGADTSLHFAFVVAGSAPWFHSGADCTAFGRIASGSGSGLIPLPPPPPVEQLPLLLSYAAGEWLPPLSSAVQQLVFDSMRLAVAGGVAASSSNIPAVLMAALEALLDWLLLVADCCCRAGGGGGGGGATAAAAAMEAAAATQGRPAADAAAGASIPGRGEDSGGSWRRLLLDDVAAVQLLGSLLHLVPALTSGAFGESVRFKEQMGRIAAACCAVAAVVPEQVRLRAVERSRRPLQQPAAAAAADTDAVANRLRSSGGGGTVLTSAGEMAQQQPQQQHQREDAPAGLPWKPELLRMLVPELLYYAEDEQASELAAATDALAEQLEAWEGGGGQGNGGEEVRILALLPFGLSPGAKGLAASMALLPPAEARRRLPLPPTCAHPGCVSLAGDSEAGRRLLSCKGCGAVSYCCRECQVSHWRAVHGQECGRGTRRGLQGRGQGEQGQGQQRGG